MKMPDISEEGKLYFIDPNPSVKLKGRVADLDGIIIEWTAEQIFEIYR